MARLESQLATVELAAVAEADGRDVAKRAGAPSTQARLRHTLRLTPGEAKRQVALATALDRDLEVTRRALSEGELSVGHVQAIARTVQDLPCDIGREVRESAEARLVELSQRFDPAQLTKLGKQILHAVDPDAGDADEARRLAEEEKRARLRRELRFVDDGHGTVWLRGRLPVEDAAVVRRALDGGGLRLGAAGFGGCGCSPWRSAARSRSGTRVALFLAATAIPIGARLIIFDIGSMAALRIWITMSYCAGFITG